MPEASAARAQPLARQGTVYGFEVFSNIPLLSVRDGGGERLEVVGPPVPGTRPGDRLAVEIQQPGFLARIYSGRDSYRMWVRAVGWFEIEPQLGRISAPASENAVQLEEILWGAPALLCFLERGDLSLHAAAVEVDGEAVLFVAPQAQGKSTLAAWFAQQGYRVLSEDLTCVRFAGRPSVVPGPPTLRLRNDVATELELDFDRRLGGGGDRVRYALASDRRDDCSPVPLRALVLLHSSEAEISLEQVEPMTALPDLWQSSFCVTADHRRRCFERIVDLAGEVPIWNLHRPLRVDALAATVQAVLRRV